MERVRGDLARDEDAVDADELLDRELGRLGLAHGVDELDHRVVRGLREPLGVHLAQLGETLVPQLGVPGVVVALPAEDELHVELGDGGDPAAERLEEAHLDPLVVADAAGGLDDAEEPGQLAPVPGRKGGTGLARFGHELIPRSSRT